VSLVSNLHVFLIASVGGAVAASRHEEEEARLREALLLEDR